MVKISAKVAYLFQIKNKYSLFRTFLAIKIACSGNLHPDKIPMLAIALGTSKNHIKKQLEELVKMGLLQHKKVWYNVVGNARYKYITGSLGKAAIDFTPFFNQKIKRNKEEQAKFNLLSSKKQLILNQLESIKDLKRLRTFCHVALQERMCNTFLKSKQLEKLKNTNQVVCSTNNSTVTKEVGENVWQPVYDVSSTFLSNCFNSDVQNETLKLRGFSPETIRRHQRIGQKFNYLSRKRIFNVLFCSAGFDNFIRSGKSKKLKKKFRFLLTETTVFEQVKSTNPNHKFKIANNELSNIFPHIEQTEKFSPIFEWKYKGKVVAIVQEVSPKVRFKVKGCKFSYSSKQFTEKEEQVEFTKVKKSKSEHATLQYERFSAEDILPSCDYVELEKVVKKSKVKSSTKRFNHKNSSDIIVL